MKEEAITEPNQEELREIIRALLANTQPYQQEAQC
jgi:hypothetical protein